MKNSMQPAYPTLVQCSDVSCWNTVNGLTKREYFAVKAMQGMLSNAYWAQEHAQYSLRGQTKTSIYQDVAEAAIKHADELLSQLESK